MTTKPPYRVPTLAEVNAAPRNGLTVISTFSGAGGSCLGFKTAGYSVLAASEFVPAARDTYRANFPGVGIEERDVREVAPADLLRIAGLAPGQVDVLEGSPPCAAFSTAGKRSKTWGQARKYSDTTQRTDDLFGEFVRLLRGIEPRAFVAENVTGLVKGVAKGTFKDVLRDLRASGYEVAAKVLDARWLGVPQARQRVIFVGVRKDLGVAPPFPEPLPYAYTVRDAIEGVANSEDDLAEASIEGTAIGRAWVRMRPGEQHDRYFNLVRVAPWLPCPTVTQTGGIRGAAAVTHPDECRKFTVPELRRLFGFPDDFVVLGDYRTRYERIGRSVPPPMMAAVARALEPVLRRRPA